MGAAGVDKRIDVIATAMRGGLSVYDLEDAELCYAPPYGSAKDAVNMAGFVAANVLRGDVALWEPEDWQAWARPGAPGRAQPAGIPQRQHSRRRAGPVDELRDRLEDLQQAKESLVFCQVGLRGYLASRILSQRGYKVRNLSGGYRRYLLWKAAAGRPAAQVR